MKPLSAKQQCILNFVSDFIANRGYPPTVRDIQSGCNISSTSVVDYNLNILVQQGHLHRDAEVSRGIGLNEARQKRLVTVPLAGCISAGEPISVPTTSSWNKLVGAETLELTEDIIKGRSHVFALKVKGNSMVDALVDDGDIVLLEPANNVQDGQIVAAWLKEKEEVTLKKFYREANHIRLQPCNAQMSPLRVHPDSIEVQGRVVAVLRQMR
jgi:repressor LexA